jgi:hypothetical protein
MSAANPPTDNALHVVPELSDDPCEPSRPTQPWHAPPALHGALGEFEPEFETDRFDFHDTIPAPPWLDEPPDALDGPVIPAR